MYKKIGIVISGLVIIILTIWVGESIETYYPQAIIYTLAMVGGITVGTVIHLASTDSIDLQKTSRINQLMSTVGLAGFGALIIAGAGTFYLRDVAVIIDLFIRSFLLLSTFVVGLLLTISIQNLALKH
jgi:hypothetical protein